MDIRQAYDRLCVNRVLKDEYKIAERKGLMQALGFPIAFKIEWIRIVLNRIHDGSL